MDLCSATMATRDHDPYEDSRRKAAHQSYKSRRKQTQPNRVQRDTNHRIVRAEPQSPEHRADELVKSYGDPVSCTICPDQFSSIQSLREHHDLVHGQSSPVDSGYPTQCHRLGRELREKEEIKELPLICTPQEQILNLVEEQKPLGLSLTSENSATSHSEQSTPVSAQVYGSESSSSTAQASSPKSPLSAHSGIIGSKDVKQRSREFCELCQKHFCNKYYLRKHKMDVHGIYSESHSAKRRHSSNAIIIGGFGANPAILTQNLFASLPDIRINYFRPMSGMPLNQMVLVPHSPGQTSENSRSPGNPSEQVIKNPDAYCEICRKVFCDKYSLKIHKANMHNIQNDHSNSLPSLTPNISPLTDATNRDIVRDTKKRDMVKNLEVKYKGQIKAEYQQRYQLAQHKMREGQKEVKPMDFSSQEYQRRSLLCSIPSVSSSMPEIPANMPITSSVDNAPLSLFSNLRSLSVPNLTSHEPGIPTSLPSTPNFQTSTASMYPNHGLDIRPEHNMQNHEPAPRKCDVCHKVFADKYALRLHRLNIHGRVHSQPTPPNMVSPENKTLVKNERKTLPGYPTSPFNMPPNTHRSSSSDENPMSTRFSSMVSDKSSDRVTCDICYKKVSSKYVLKDHKINVHGCDPASVGKVMRPKQKISSISPESSRNQLLKPFADDPIKLAKAEELLKMGIDPEAYCEICKKEFSSKYFLRTHKLNMHGIPTDKPGNRKEDREISRKILEREVMVMRELDV